VSVSWSALALGCEPLGGTDCGESNRDALRASVRVALDRGISVFDTADVYGLGESERELASALGNDRHAVTIVTKGGVRWRDTGGGQRALTWKDASAAYLNSAIDASLARLGLESIPVYLVHWPDPKTPLAETIDCLERARAAGKIGSFGLSNFPIDVARAWAAGSNLSVLEAPLSLLSERRTVAELAASRAGGLRTLTYGSLGQGFLTGKYGPDWVFPPDDRRSRLPQFAGAGFTRWGKLLDELATVARQTGSTAAQIALRWALETGAATTVIVGAKSAQHVIDACAALEFELTHEQSASLAEAQHAATPTHHEMK
jgi:aryl-alcohol dehydrogenase-like predicted oxidoreductase